VLISNPPKSLSQEAAKVWGTFALTQDKSCARVGKGDLKAHHLIKNAPSFAKEGWGGFDF